MKNWDNTVIVIAAVIIGFFGGIAFVNNWLVMNKYYPEIGMFQIPFKAHVWGTVSDWVIVIATVATAIAAFIALTKWRNEKQFEIEINAKANLTNCIYVIKKICFAQDERSPFLLENEYIKHEKHFEQVKHSKELKFHAEVYDYSRSKYYEELKDILPIMRVSAIGLANNELRSIFKELIDIYESTSAAITDIKTTLHFIRDAHNSPDFHKWIGNIEIGLENHYQKLNDKALESVFKSLERRAKIALSEEMT
ncbi:hypothetical protein [Sphingobacterium pedocola]|uniref:Phage abortive infection protein n=1 Tax=Sphingobacterium pedocola TaxID=2082722 RepID=A0ABR9T686_9SPHI|nr:hypothetical protein [Sphingobacterium pedocola]MBE8720856.1 hypothetical protein [Sphingobacterium pedocola]